MNDFVKFIKKYSDFLIMLFLWILSFYVGTLFLSYGSLGRNEPLSLQTSQMNLLQFLKPNFIDSLFSAPDQMPLYFWLLNVWKFLVGNDKWWLRYLSVFFYQASIIVNFILLKRIYRKLDSFLISLLLIFNLFYFDQVQYIRF